ncbi:MAG TPA: NAD(P)-dependent alcohol dehydrogenase [Bacteroidales bacterium]|nr:NAD(P)-dependent alcohol dehydrogenase [Bacteroidales bacterium]
MKAIICTKYGEPEVLQIQEVAKPIPKDNEVCINIFATAVSASDCIVRSGKVSFWFWLPMRLAIGLTKPRQPILGITFSGVIETIGKNVTKFKKGDQVFGWDLFPAFGAYAEFKCISDNGIITQKPNNLNYEEAAAIPFGGLLALSVLRKTKSISGQKILIYGASGAVGTSAVQLAKFFGAEVTGVCSTTNLELVKSLGADKVIDYTIEDFTKNGTQYDIIFDSVGKSKFKLSKQQYGKSLTSNGKLISVDGGTPKVSIEDLILLKEQVEAGKIKPVIDKTYKLEQIVDAHKYVDKGHKKGNVIIKI